MDYTQFDFIKTKDKKDKKKIKNELLMKLMRVPIKDSNKMANKFRVYDDGYQQMADLLFLPDDHGYKYCLTVVDCGNRKTDCEPLKNKETKTVLDAFQKIYKRKILEIPKRLLIVDEGTEFKGVVSRFFKNNNVMIKRTKPDRHQQLGLVEARNKIIGKIIYMSQNANELKNNIRDKSWVYLLPKIVTEMNKHFGLTQNKMDKVKDKLFNSNIKGDKNTELLDFNEKIRVSLDAPQDIITGKKLHGKFRSSDLRFEPKIRKIEDINLYPDSQPLYKVTGIPRVNYTRNQLQIVDNDEEIVGDKYKVDKILGKIKKNGRIYYKIKWTDYKNPTIEPRSNLIHDIKGMIDEYEKKNK